MISFDNFSRNFFSEVMDRLRGSIFDSGRFTSTSRPRRFAVRTRSGRTITIEPGMTMRRRADHRRKGRNGCFKGCVFAFEEACDKNVEIFLPQQNSGYFEHPMTDLSGKFIVFDVAKVVPSDSKNKLKIIADARPPLERALSRQRRELERGSDIFWSLSVDHDREYLIFPLEGGGQLLVDLREAQSFAGRRGCDTTPSALTGMYWKLRVNEEYRGDLFASPISINTDLH